MRGTWAEVHECEVRDCGSFASLFHPGGEHVVDVSVFKRHDRTIDVQADKQGLSFRQEITEYDPDVAMAVILTVLHVWKYRVNDDSEFPRVYARILRTLRSCRDLGFVSPSIHYLCDYVTSRREMLNGEMAEAMRERLADSMRWMREHAAMTEEGLVRLWREAIVEEVLDD